MYAIAIVTSNQVILGRKYTTSTPINAAFKRLRVKYPQAQLVTVHVTDDGRCWDLHDKEIILS